VPAPALPAAEKGLGLFVAASGCVPAAHIPPQLPPGKEKINPPARKPQLALHRLLQAQSLRHNGALKDIFSHFVPPQRAAGLVQNKSISAIDNSRHDTASQIAGATRLLLTSLPHPDGEFCASHVQPCTLRLRWHVVCSEDRLGLLDE
jgi:hypothetical protein